MHVYTRDIAADTPVYRARLADPNETFMHEAITSPPLVKTRDGRMGPRGISYFYGALDRDTAVAEVQPYLGARVGIAEFRSASPIGILDLADLPATKAEGDDSFLPFMSEFAQEVSKPIAPQDEALDYIPTQAFCEFLQTSAADHFIQGVKYGSAMRRGGNCLVIFRDQTISLGPDTGTRVPREHWLKFAGVKYLQVQSIDFRCKEI